MTGLTYLGPSDVLVIGNTAYQQGDEVPMSRDEAEHHARAGHRFSVSDDDDKPQALNPSLENFQQSAAYELVRGNPNSTSGTGPAPDPVPRDDRGAPMEGVKFAEDRQSRRERARGRSRRQTATPSESSEEGS